MEVCWSSCNGCRGVEGDIEISPPKIWHPFIEMASRNLKPFMEMVNRDITHLWKRCKAVVVISPRGGYSCIPAQPTLQPCPRSRTSNLLTTSFKSVNKFRSGNESDERQPGKFKWHQTHSDQQLSTHATTDDRCANFLASTCPTQNLKVTASSERVQAATQKISSAAWPRFLG
jgi:hypothetical protein